MHKPPEFQKNHITVLFLAILFTLTSCAPTPKITTPTKIISFSPIPISTKKPSATPYPTYDPTQDYYDPTFDQRVLSTSPDGMWWAYARDPYDKWNIGGIASKDGKIRWKLENPHQKYGWYEWDYNIYRWSQEKNYVYLTLWVGIDGFFPFSGPTGLYRFNLTNGSMVEILPGQKADFGRFSLSPDEKLLATINDSENSALLSIENFDASTIHVIELIDYSFAGNMIWSPSQEKIILSVGTGNDWDNFQTWILLVNLTDGSQTVIYSDQQYTIRSKEWINNDTILVESDTQLMYFNLMNKSLKIVPTAPPRP